MSVLAFTVTTVAEALVNKIVLPASVAVRVRAVVASVINVATGLSNWSWIAEVTPSTKFSSVAVAVRSEI
jgi:hypothetical protein